MNNFLRKLELFLNSRSNPRTKEWWEKYLKGVIPFFGIGIPELRDGVRALYAEEKLERWSEQDKLNLSHLLFQRKEAEYKLAAILLYQEFWLAVMEPVVILNSLEQIFDEGLIFDWNTNDWLCVRVLTPLVQRAGEEILTRLDRWVKSEQLWKARSAVVALCQLDDLTPYKDRVQSYAATLLCRPERFARSAVGWVLREYSRRDMDTVLQILEDNKDHLTLEVFHNAGKYLEKEEQKSLQEKLKPSPDKGTE